MLKNSYFLTPKPVTIFSGVKVKNSKKVQKGVKKGSKKVIFGQKWPKTQKEPLKALFVPPKTPKMTLFRGFGRGPEARSKRTAFWKGLEPKTPKRPKMTPKRGQKWVKMGSEGQNLGPNSKNLSKKVKNDHFWPKPQNPTNPKRASSKAWRFERTFDQIANRKIPV